MDTAIKILNECAKSSGWNGFDELISQGQPQSIVNILLKAMKKHALLLCYKQKEICADNAQVEDYFGTNYVDTKSILNSPYPEELKQ